MYATIIGLEQFRAIRKNFREVIVTSGGYDPIHPGHLTSIIESAKFKKGFNDALVVVVNGDWFLRNKKGKSFQDLDTRCRIVSCIREVDYVIPFEIENDSSVKEALLAIQPTVYTKGGDRQTPEDMPEEWAACKSMGTDVHFGIGLDKHWSSSNFLKDWEEFVLKKHGSIKK